MLNKMHKNYDVNKKYGIRKFTVGVFSVALGLIIVPEVGNIDFNGNVVKHEVRAAETTNVQFSAVASGDRVLVNSNTIEFEKNSFIKNTENIINKTLNFTNKKTVEENRIFENSNNEKIKYGLDIKTQDVVYNIKNNKIVITNPNKAKIEYSLRPVNTYAITEVEKGKYQIKHNYVINRSTEDIYAFLKSLQDFNHEISNGNFTGYSLTNSGISDKIDNYVRNLKSLREAEIRNNGVSKEQDITRMINLLKDAETELKTNYSVTDFSGTENETVQNFMQNINYEFTFFFILGWDVSEESIKAFAYGANTTYTVVRKEDDKEVGTFTIDNKGVSNTLTLPDGEYKIVEKKVAGRTFHSTYAEDKDLTVRTVENSTDQVIYQATYNGKDIGNKVIVEQDGERVGKQYTVSLEEQEDKDTGLVYRPKQSSYTGTVKATNGITRVEYEPVMVNGPITFKPPFKSQVPIELFPEGSVQKGTVSRVTLTDITDENGTVWTPNITKPRAGKIDEITYSIKEVRGKSLEQEQLEQGWQKAQRTDKVEIDYGNYLLIGSFSAPKFDGTIGSPAIYMFDKRANKDITHVFAGRYNWSVWDSAQIVRGANKSLFKYDLNKASFYKKDNAVKAIVETADGRIETILSKGSHGGILVETKYTNKQGKTVNFGYSRYVDTYLDNNDRVSVFSLGNNDGVYMETDKYRLDYFMKVPDAPDNFDSRFYNKLSGIETNGRKDTPDMMTPNTLLLSKTVDSGIQLGWKDKPLANGETRTMGVEVKLSFASKINSEFSRNRENWDTNTTSRELYPNLPINYDLTGTINPELLGDFTKATVSITIPDGITLSNNTVSVLNNDNTVKTTLNGTYNSQTKTFTVEVPKEQTKNNNFKIRLNIKATSNTSKSYTFTERIDVDNDINAGEKTNTAILNIVQNNRNIAVKYVDEKGNILKDSVISSQQRGTTYNVSSVSKPTTLSFNDASYSYLGTEGNLTGTLTDNAVISHVYRSTKGANITVKYLAGTTEVVAPLVLEGNLNSKIPTVNKPDVIRKNGKLYKLSTNNTDFSNTRFTNNTQSFTVNYDELATANYVYKKVVNRNGVLETLGESTVIYREGDKVGTSYNLTAPETFNLNNKKYKIKNIADKNITGQVKGTETTSVKNIEYNEVISSPITYQPTLRNNPLGTPKVIASTDTVVGGNYNVIPEEIVVNGIKYAPKNNRAITGVIDSGKTINVEYEEKQGNNEVSYQPKFNGRNLGNPISIKDQITNKNEGVTFEVSPKNEITVDNKVYKLKNSADKVRGTITKSPQTKEIEYVAKTGILKYQPKLNGNNLGELLTDLREYQVGETFNITPKTIKTNNRVYIPINNTVSGVINKENNIIDINYKEKVLTEDILYSINLIEEGGTTRKAFNYSNILIPKGTPVGSVYKYTPQTLNISNLFYEPVNKNEMTFTVPDPSETTDNYVLEYRRKQGNVEISYQPKFNGNNLGNSISIKSKILEPTLGFETVEKLSQEGLSFSIPPKSEITIDNKVYKLKNPTDKVSGTITQNPQTKEIEYVAKNSSNNLTYQPKFNGNALGTPVEITPITQIGSSYNVLPKDITVDGKIYEPVVKNNLTGRVSENNSPIEVNYQPKLSNKALSYQSKVNGTPIGNPIELVPNNSQIGTPYNVTPKDIIVNGRTYEPVSKNNITGRTTENNTPVEVEYREKQGNTEISYQPKLNGNNLGTPISVRNQITNTQEGSSFEVSPNNEITVDNKVYKLKNTTDKVIGTITQSPQTKEIEYVVKNSSNNLIYQPKFNGNTLGTPIEITPITQVGTSYNVVPKDITIDGKTYEPVSKETLTGRVSENNSPIEVNYQPKLNNKALSYQPKVNGTPIGKPIELVPSNSQIGTPYNVVPKEIIVDGKVYEPVIKDNLTGGTTEDNTSIEIEYRAKQGNNEISYQPKFNGSNLGTPVSIKEQITDKQEGAKFEITPNSEITIDNKVYKLKNTTDKVSGTITQSPQVKEIEYVAKNSNNNLVYQPKFNNTNLGNPVEITPITQVGTSYNVVPKDITVDGKVYESISKEALTGRVDENNSPIEVNYQPKLSNNALNYQPKVNGTPIGNPIELVPSNSQVGTSYEIVPKDITINGKVYEPIVKNNLTGRSTEDNTLVEVEYKAKQGNNEISYQPKFNGNNLGTPISVKEQITDKQEGATFEISPNNEITIDNKVYKLKNDTDKVSGTITQSPQTKEIEYVVKNSNNNLGYQPKLNGNNLGDSIEITPITQVGTSYNVIPKDITVDGKVYESISKEALTGRVLENNTPIEVNYQPKLSNKALSYQPKVNGTPIGNPIEIIPNNSQIGTPYEITPQEITIDGKVYEPVVKNNLTGRTTEENTPIEVEYRVKQGNTEISYQPKFNGNNLGTPISVKEQITDKQEGANFEITPNNEITIDNKVYKLKNSVDKVRGTITQSPQTKEIEYVAKNSNNNLVYQPKVNGDNLGTPIEISPIAQIGTSYETAPKEITVDGKVYEPISKNVLTGRVSENNTPIEVSYQPKLSNNTLNYQPKVNGTPIGKPIELVPSNSQVGTPYTVLPKEITVDGKVYEPISKNALTGRVSENNSPIEVNYQPKLSNKALNYQPKVNENTIGKPIELVPSNSQIGTPYNVVPKEIIVDGKVYEPVVKNNLTGRTTENNTPIEIEYRAKQGNTEISYQPKVNNENLGTPISVKEQITDKQEGANFEISPNNEITVDNKVYKLKNSADKVSGTITQSPQTKEIEYVAKNSNNNLVYQPKFNGTNLGNSIEIVPISQIGTPYNVIPKEITIDGKVYETISKNALTGRVSENNSPLNVNYQPKLSNNALNYQPKFNGNNLGNPIELVPTNSQVGTSYNVIPKKLLIDGKLYTPVNKDTLTGNLLENNGTINIEYKEAKDYNETFKQFKEIEKDVSYVSADKDKKEAYDKELKVLSNLLKGEKDPSDIEKSIANLNKLKEALNGKANLLKAVEKAKEEISKLTYIIPQADPILDMLDEPSMIDIEVITNIVEDAKELNNTVKEIVKVLDKHNEKDIDYKKATPEKKEEYNKKAKEILEALKDKTLNKEKALEKAKELNKVSENLDGIENKQKQDAIISEIEKNTNLPKEVKEKLVETIENTTSSDELNNLLDKGKTIDKEIKDNKKLIEENQGSNLSDKEKEEYNKALKELIDVLSNPKSTKEEISKAKEKLSTIKDKVEESNNIKELENILSNSNKEMNLSKAKELLEKISSKLDGNDNNSKELKAILSKTELTKEDIVKAKELLDKIEYNNKITELNNLLSNEEINISQAKELLISIKNKLDKNNVIYKELENILSKSELTKEDFLKAKELLTKVQSDKGISPDTEKTFTLEYKDENNKVIKTSVFPNSKKENTDLLYPKELISDNGEKYIRNSDNTYSLVVSNSKPLENKKEKSVVDEDNNNVKPITDKKDVVSTNDKDKEVKSDNKEATIKKEELPKTSSSMLSTLGLFSIFGLRKNRKKDK